MSESTIQADIQRELLRLSTLFSTGDVVICDWSVLDGSSQAAPFVVIDASDTFETSGITTSQSTTWQIPINLIVRFVDWDTSRLAMRDARAAVLAHLIDTPHYQSASAALAWGLRTISAGTGIEEIYDRYNENVTESLPVYLTQTITLEVEEI